MCPQCIFSILRSDHFDNESIWDIQEAGSIIMKLYKSKDGIVAEQEEKFFLMDNTNWDELLNDDLLTEKLQQLVSGNPTGGRELINDLLAPVGQQEIWACGVTYLRSKIGRQEESKDAGGGDFYAKVYEAERPEVFFKSTARRVVGPYGKVRIRRDSTWDVPEPELTLVVNSSAKIIGYTIGNDMSSRSIEGENPLYLPQAKTYDGSAAIGPCILVTDKALDPETRIHLQIFRADQVIQGGNIAISQIKRKFEELTAYVFRECSFPEGCLIMTGTGIVPESDFTLQSGDVITIAIDGIGELTNTVA